ncbi:MAG: RecQ family zinc-binding domain-containing protein, partial [Flavobacteriales bacterium]|nr:RecQ family zinc-binding domain-containing protein [Flavobacteriales bacterium]
PLGAGEGITYPFPLNQFCDAFQLEYVPAFHAIGLLERAGYLAFSESVMQPSRLYINATRNALYDFQVLYPTLDSFIKLLLRLYGGLFETYVNIREEEIARVGKLEEKQVIHQLQVLHKQGIVDYVQRTGDPQISYTIPRISETALRFPAGVYTDRKKNEAERVVAMKHYLQDRQCRSQLLLSYFGEKRSEPCGKCDVCRDNKSHGFTSDEYHQMNAALTDLLLKSSIKLDQLSGMMPDFPADKLMELASWKLDRGELILNDRLELKLPGLDDEIEN